MNLQEYQDAIRAELSNLEGDLILVAPTGAGVRDILTPAIKDWGEMGLVLILTDRIDASYQWSERLKQQGQGTRILTGTEDIMAARDGGSNGIVIGTLQRISIGVGRRYLQSISPAFAVVDAGTLIGDQAKQVVSLLRAKQTKVVFISHRMQSIEWFGDVSVISVPLQAILEASSPSLMMSEYRYDVPPSDSAIMERARALLSSAGVTGVPLGVQGIHNSLLRLATRNTIEVADEPDYVDDELPPNGLNQETLAQAWSLIEELEATFEDTRLNTLISIVRDGQTAHRPCVIVTRSIAECDYLSAALLSAGLSSRVLSGRLSFKERDTVRSQFGPRGALVVTQTLLDAVPATRRPLVVLWSAARTRAGILELILRTAIWSGELVLMVPEPAAADENALADSIREIAAAVASGEEFVG